TCRVTFFTYTTLFRSELQRRDVNDLRFTVWPLDRGIRPDGATMTVGDFLTGEWLPEVRRVRRPATAATYAKMVRLHIVPALGARSEEHTSELQSLAYL